MKKELKLRRFVNQAILILRFEAYQNIVQIGGLRPKDHPAASHKIIHNYKTLREMFETAGFEVRLLEYYDENGIFRDNEWDGADRIIFRSKNMTREIKEISSFSHQ